MRGPTATLLEKSSWLGNGRPLSGTQPMSVRDCHPSVPGMLLGTSRKGETDLLYFMAPHFLTHLKQDLAPTPAIN